MEDMKYDMCGAAAVIGLMQALPRCARRVRVIGIVGHDREPARRRRVQAGRHR